MEDQRNGRGPKNRAPFEESERFALLSPQNESYDGPQYAHNPVSAGEVPKDPAGFFPKGTEEVPDSKFRARNERRK